MTPLVDCEMSCKARLRRPCSVRPDTRCASFAFRARDVRQSLPRDVRQSLPRALRWAGAALVIALAVACDPPETSSSAGSGGSGAGGSGSSSSSGGCLPTPQPTFALRVLDEAGGFVPPDTTIEVSWSAGVEPAFHLDDPSTWGTPESNVICDVDPSQPPPEDLPVLSCALWTASPTEVEVSAKGFITKGNTYKADPVSGCDPEPTPIEIELPADHP
jgi:hypothetical protein